MTRIPVQATVAPGFPPLDALALDLVEVTQDGSVAKELGRFPVAGGAAEVPDVPLADPALRWAIRVVRHTALGVPVYRSGPLGFLPGGPRSHIFGDRIRLHRGGGNLGLDAPDGAPQVLVDFVRDNLPGAFALLRLDLGADAQGRYVLTVAVRYRPLPIVDVSLEYSRGFAVAPGIDPGRPRRVAVAWPQGPGSGVPAALRSAVDDLDRVLAAGVEAQMSAMAFHIGFLMLLAEGVTDLTPQTASLTAIRITPRGSEVDASVSLVSGAVTGGIRVFDPVPVVLEPAEPGASVGTMDDYLAGLPPEQRAALAEVRAEVARLAPDAVEGTSYGVPAFLIDGRPLLGFRAAARHLSVFPFSPEAVDAVRDRLDASAVSKGTIRFTPEAPLPAGLLEDLVRARRRELEA